MSITVIRKKLLEAIRNLQVSADMIVRAADLYDGINMLDNNVACGVDCIAAGNLFTCSCLTISLAIWSMVLWVVVHCLKAIMSMLFVPVLKDHFIGQDYV